MTHRDGSSSWADARIVLEIVEPGSAPPRSVAIDRPYGLVGRTPQADVRIDDPAVSARHVYLHADARGLYVVDLESRTGFRRLGRKTKRGWLRPGDAIEVADRSIRLVSLAIAGELVSPPPCSVDLLAETDRVLAPLGLETIGRPGACRFVRAELALVGRGDACSFRLNQADVSKTHCVLLRTAEASFVVDLPGRPTLVDDVPVRAPIKLVDGVSLAFGRARFVVRLREDRLDRRRPTPSLERPLMRLSAPVFGAYPKSAREPFPVPIARREKPRNDRGLELEAVVAAQAEIRRRQEDLRGLLASIRESSGRPSLDLAVERLDDLDAKIARIDDALGIVPASPGSGEDEVERQEAETSAPKCASSIEIRLPAVFTATPLAEPPPAPEIDPKRSLASAAWLLERIDDVSNVNRFSFRSLLDRFFRRKPAEVFDDLAVLEETDPSTQLPSGGQGSDDDVERP